MGPRIDNDLTILVDALTAMHRASGQLTELTAQLRGMTVNDVLSTETAEIGADGTYSRDWTVPFGSVSVVNHGSRPLVVTSGSAQAGSNRGPGTHIVVRSAVVNLAGTTLTVYGVAGQLISLQVFSRPQPPTHDVGPLPAETVHDAAGAGDVDLVDGPGVLRGWAAGETSGAPASFRLLDGPAGAVLVPLVTLAANQSTSDAFAGVAFTNGLRLERMTGDTEVAAYVDPAP